MARKKIVFVIVEGPTDDTALGVFLNNLYDTNSVYIHITHGDITTKTGNIKNRIKDVVYNYAKSNHFNKSHFQEVVHIVDMDGAYIDNNAIGYDEHAIKPMYYEDKIIYCNPENIVYRNEIKRDNIDTISSLPTVWGGVPYQSYYMSCNLDHVLYDKMNSSDDEKENDAYNFAKTYKNDSKSLIDFFCKSAFSVNGEYLDSWDFIKKDNNSLHRYTNFGICINRALAKTNSDTSS